MTPVQRAAVCGQLDRLASAGRAHGLNNQAIAEFLLSVGARWLAAHGVAASNIHLWIDHELAKPAPQPLTAAAQAANDFGSGR